MSFAKISAAFTALISAGRSSLARSAPGSLNRIASAADASKTRSALLTLSFRAPLGNKLIHYRLSRLYLGIFANKLLGTRYRLGACLKPPRAIPLLAHQHLVFPVNPM